MQIDTNTQLIGIHNQDPLTLYIQFSVGDKYYIYERDCVTKSESIKEEIFGHKVYTRQSLNHGTEQSIAGKNHLLPQNKKSNPRLSILSRDYPF